MGKPRPVNFTGIYRDTDPFVAADGKRLYFASDRPIDGKPFKDYEYHYFYVELDGDKIGSKPVLFNLPVPADINPTYLSFADNGNAYFFSSDGVSDADLYVCKFKNGKYLPPEKLPFNDKKYFDFDPVIAGDESFIIFCSSNRKGIGSGDLWVSFKKNTTWTEPINMGSRENTRGNDGAPGLSRDNKTLYFTSFRETTERPAYKHGKITAEAINKLLHSTKNGLRSIYEISIEDLKP
jgi:Tol biopolymer transport system component